MQSTKTTRSEELRQAIQAATVELDDARTRLGSAVADSDEAQAEAARADVARLERLLSELNAARPIALRREEAARREAQEKAQREREREANKARKARVAAAAKVDKALAALGRTYREYLATAPGGRPDDAHRLSRRSRQAIAAALAHHAPELARELIEPAHRPPQMHRRPLTSAVEGAVHEFPEDDAE